MKLTPADEAFLKSNNATLKDVCDIRHIKSVKEKYEYIKSKGKTYGYGNPCTNGGHRIKRRSGGHCGPCTPLAGVYSARYTKDSYVYIAGSIAKQYMKVGISDQPEARISMLCSIAYAGAKDWELLFHVKVPDAGQVEHDAGTHLEKCKLRLGYIKDGKKQEAIEVAKCNFDEAYDALSRVVVKTLSNQVHSKNIRLYTFK